MRRRGGDRENRSARTERHHDITNLGVKAESRNSVVPTTGSDNPALLSSPRFFCSAENFRENGLATQNEVENFLVVRVSGRRKVSGAAGVRTISDQLIKLRAQARALAGAIPSKPPRQPIVRESDGGNFCG